MTLAGDGAARPGGQDGTGAVASLPGGLEVRAGAGRVVVVAPHGGLSPRDLLVPADGPTRSNDLHTVGVASVLAERLGGSLLANGSLDRNELDLNRIDAVCARAPWLLDVLADLIERAVSRHGNAIVLFVHGWHIAQPKCDLGIGARLPDPGAADPARLTVSPEFLYGTLERMRAECAAAGVPVAYGERWPAAHPNNVMQLFRRHSDRAFDGGAARIAALARRGATDAVQLELGATVRWPGPVRDGFVGAVSRALVDDGPRVPDRPPAPRPGAGMPAGRAPDGGASPGQGSPASRAVDSAAAGRVAPAARRGLSVEIHDDRAGEGGLGLAAAIGPMPGGRLGARLLLFPGGRRLALFTGEDRDDGSLRVGALRAERTAERVVLKYGGPVLLAPDGSRHFGSEAEQARARVVDLAIELDFELLAGEYGRAAGVVVVDGERHLVDATGFVPSRRGAADRASIGVPTSRITAGFGPDLGMTIVARPDDGGLEARRFTREGAHDVVVSGRLDATGVLPAPIELECDRLRLRGEPRAWVSWLRGDAASGFALLRFGVARFGLGSDGGSGPGRRGGGFFEQSIPVPWPGRGPANGGGHPA